MVIEKIKFPVLCFSQGLVLACRNMQELSICNKTALKNGYFKNLELIDSSNTSYTIIDAKEVGGVGLFGGYNVFLNKRIKVQLFFKEETNTMILDQIKEKILKSTSSLQLWSTRDDFEVFKMCLKNAISVEAIIDILDTK